MLGNLRTGGELVTYPDSTAVEAVLLWPLHQGGLWVLPRDGGEQAYCYTDFSAADWESVYKSQHSAGKTWHHIRKLYEVIHNNTTPPTCSRDAFFATAGNNRNTELIIIIHFDSVFHF